MLYRPSLASEVDLANSRFGIRARQEVVVGAKVACDLEHCAIAQGGELWSRFFSETWKHDDEVVAAAIQPQLQQIAIVVARDAAEEEDRLTQTLIPDGRDGREADHCKRAIA